MMEDQKTAEDYELFHYGVKGMRWGVRKKQDGGDGGGGGGGKKKTAKPTKAEVKLTKAEKKQKFLEDRDAATERVVDSMVRTARGRRAQSEKIDSDYQIAIKKASKLPDAEKAAAEQKAWDTLKRETKELDRGMRNDMKASMATDDYKKATTMTKGEKVAKVLIGYENTTYMNDLVRTAVQEDMIREDIKRNG